MGPSFSPPRNPLLSMAESQLALEKAPIPAASKLAISSGNCMEMLANLIIGWTNGLRKRLQQHCRAGSGHNRSPFEFFLNHANCADTPHAL